ncbi:anticodon nuclease [Commensalibacter papalotli (ex Botero et al. 2024)]|uniref:Wobble nucleotide-excising tRNase (RloC) (PUBMED:18681940) n=1 Tax=Commensalibacter papalotli (ex Botero et al. 2024) TaxID=2972766 RepID=A0ABM9HLG0_9PROT|nr:anticodon nuclease [Commensalibacter papalotli (ex Botero et al. 2024)]CAI3932552.1 Wobble nucleotide-excising tRNase (RloC) (PUBMED:18681940) [Commensalibacter papalotli (ex Botero et al. 2024)]CAI3946141.1 Wobble nucleotide-excising tRNase (RloC) (PUBMED:18681940) [Commensalibacter papalotli (ex Botero et al. 2024)]
MGKTLKEIAQDLKDSKKKVQLIYAFNGTGKTRLSREFKNLINGDPDQELTRNKLIYYNAYTEDLFFWDNDSDGDTVYTLRIQKNSFIKWVLEDEGKEGSMTDYFQRYVHKNLTPIFEEVFSKVTFSFEGGNDNQTKKIKISKGEESCFIWSIFYTLIEQIVAELNIPEIDNRSTHEYDQLEYVFIDDPVSSLDENHLIELAVDLAVLIKSSQSKELKFIITTHNPLFYNVLYNELSAKSGIILQQNDDGTFEIDEKQGDSNQSFSYHLFLKTILEDAVTQKNVQRYHFTLLRNLYEKTACFLGYQKWSELLPGEKQLYLSRMINFTSHSSLSNEQIAEPNTQEKEMVNFLLKHLLNEYNFYQKDQQKVTK